MKKIILFVAFSLLILGTTGTLLAYEGGTKMVAALNHPEKGEFQFSPILLVPHDSLTPGKAVTKLVHRFPQPSLSTERIREERSGRSMGTKAVARFWKEGRI